MQFKKWPLFIGALPFVAGLLTSFLFSVPVLKVVCVLLPLLIITLLLTFFRSVFFQRDKLRLLISGTALFVFGYLLFSVNDFRLQSDRVGRYYGEEGLFSGVVLESKQGIAGRQQLLLEVDGCFQGDSSEKCAGKVVVFVKDDGQLFRHGDQLLVAAQIQQVKNAGNPGEFDAEAFYRSRRIEGFIFTSSFAIEKTGHCSSLSTLLTDWREYLSTKMEEHLDGTFLAIAKALILGDKSDLDDETMRVFSTTGSMHVLAVSGLHIGLILLMLQRVLQVFSRWITKRQSILIAIALIWVYGGITGASPAVMRAVVMFSILSGSQLLGRQYQGLNGLGLSLFLLLSWDPWMLFDLGFQLSYLAMLGIFLLYKPIVNSWIPAHKWIRMGWEGTAVGCAATVLTTPVILLWFYQFPNYFALANLGVMLFGFLVLITGMLFLASVWVPFVVKVSAVVFAFAVIGLVAWVSWVDSLPGAVSGGFHLNSWELITAYVIIGGWILHLNLRKGKRWWFALSGLALIVWWSINRYEIVQSDELVVFNSNRFVAAVKKEKVLIGVYDAKWNGSWVVPDELIAYARYSGCHLELCPLYGSTSEVKINGDSWSFSRVKEGITIQNASKDWFYRSDGIPDLRENPHLMATRIQLQLHPDKSPKPYILPI